MFGKDATAASDGGVADAMPLIVWTHDVGGTPTYFNRFWCEYTGKNLEETLQAGASTFVHPDDRQEVIRLFAESRATGRAVQTQYRLRRGKDGSFRWHTARVVPLADTAGKVLGFVGTALDVEEERRGVEKQRFLVEAGRVLGASLELSRTLSDVARLVVPTLADWSAIDLLDESGRFQRAAVAHVDPSKVALANRLWERMPPRPEDPAGPYGVVARREPNLVENITDEMLVESLPDPEILALYRELGLKSSLVVPLVARDRVLGILTLVNAESGRHFERRDLPFGEETAHRIAIAVDNARLYGEVQEARNAAEAMATDVVEQSRAVREALLEMRAERDAALSRAAEAERNNPGSSNRA